MTTTLDAATAAGYQHVSAGKVREIYTVDQDTLLLVATDRISAYDYILASPIPDKGRVLTAMSFFWFEALGVKNHLAGPATDPRIPAALQGRSMIVKKLKMLPFECVARGYLTGSGLKEYQATGSVCGVELPEGLTEASKLPTPIFTPATKAELGDHDENVTFARVVADLGEELATKLRDTTLDLYQRAAEIAAQAGVILADTKFEFGLDENGDLVLADEVLTPDSSRFWPLAGYEPGKVQPSFDKQFVRDWLKANWNMEGEPPAVPADVTAATRARYVEAYEKISGTSFSLWPGGAES